jgi:hypothetical protein
MLRSSVPSFLHSSIFLYSYKYTSMILYTFMPCAPSCSFCTGRFHFMCVQYMFKG